MSLRSFRALRPGGRLVIYGRQNTIAHGRKNWPGGLRVVRGTATRRAVGLTLTAPTGCSPIRSRSCASTHQDWFREDFGALLELLRADKIHPVVAERLPLSEARRAHELLERTAATGKLVLVP